MMASVLERLNGSLSAALMVWRKVRVGIEKPSSGWYAERFLNAATVVVDRWGPSWARKRVGGAPVGAWLLVMMWLGVPVILLYKLW
jgi:hypothetical protein